MADKKKYNKMEPVLQYINKNFVTVSDEDAKKANPVLKHIMETIINAMKKVSPLFSVMYESILYGGSYYDGLKVGKPEEFDIDLKLVLPKLVAPKLNISNQPGFVTVQMTGWATFEKSPEFAKYKGLADFKDENNYLMVNKVLQWIESTANLAMNEIGKVGNKAQIPYNGKVAEVSLKKSGPAVTALIQYGDIYMDVDLVAVFKLTSDLWPPSPFRPLPTECNNSNGKKEFLIVPKTPKAAIDKKERCWRMSFQEQEKVLIMGNNTCKPVLRLIKKLRDAQNHKSISSYFIKTVFLHEIEKQDKQFWNAPLCYIFMHMLKTYRDYLGNYKIPYYWNQNNNLLQYIDNITIDNFKNFLNKVIDSVDKKLEENPYIIGEFLCTQDECEKLKKVTFVTGKSKSNGQDSTQNSCITENPDLDTMIVKLVACKVDGPSTKDTNQTNNDVVITMLTEIQKGINNLQFDMKTALNKIFTLEQSVQDLKNDNNDFKTILKELIHTNSETDDTLENKESEKQSCNMEFMLDKIDYLHKSVQDLKTENDLLKTGLRQFVLLE